MDPAVALTRGRHTVTLNVPITIYTNYRRRYYELVRGRQFGGGLPTHMFLATYSLRLGL